MLDYRGVEALHTVQEEQSFELAAKKLHITQSAVSQRIKSLEVHYGEPLLVRTLPYHPTDLGKKLIAHFKKVMLLEKDLQKGLQEEVMPRVSVALNRDSLETWFLDFAAKIGLFRDIILEVVSDDQELTLDHFKDGMSSACISTSSKEVLGGRAEYLGSMKYLLVASPEFKKKYFHKTVTKKSLMAAPAIRFDKEDKLHDRYLEKFFNIDPRELNYHTIPSVRGFKQFVISGYGYALLPQIEAKKELENGKLVQLSKDRIWEMPLYWHYWSIESMSYRKLNEEIISRCKALIY